MIMKKCQRINYFSFPKIILINLHTYKYKKSFVFGLLFLLKNMLYIFFMRKRKKMLLDVYNHATIWHAMWDIVILHSIHIYWQFTTAESFILLSMLYKKCTEHKPWSDWLPRIYLCIFQGADIKSESFLSAPFSNVTEGAS